MLQVDIRRKRFRVEEDAGPFKLFLKLCGHRVGEGRLGNVDEQKRYVGMLWTRLRARRYKDGKRNRDMATVATMLSQRRTSVYAQLCRAGGSTVRFFFNRVLEQHSSHQCRPTSYSRTL
jgi:hypothetical protein